MTADVTSGARFEHEYFADDEMTLVAMAEFFRHAQLARAVTSLGQRAFFWSG